MKLNRVLLIIVILLVAFSGFQQYQISKLRYDLDLINDGSNIIINYAFSFKEDIAQLQSEIDEIKSQIKLIIGR